MYVWLATFNGFRMLIQARAKALNVQKLKL